VTVWGVKMVSLGIRESLNHKQGDIICRRIPLFHSLIIYFLCSAVGN
jgi:hypothetical protein